MSYEPSHDSTHASVYRQIYGQMTLIEWSVTTPDGEKIWGRIAIDQERASKLYPGRPPMPFEAFGVDVDYRRRVERSNAFAQVIAGQVAGDILRACDPDERRKTREKGR